MRFFSRLNISFRPERNRRPAFIVSGGGSVRSLGFVFLLLLFVLSSFGSGPAAGPDETPAPASGDQAMEDSAHESLKDMPWYDAPERDYHEYTREEIRKIMNSRKDEGDGDRGGAQPGAIPAGLFKVVMYVILTVLILAAAYVLYPVLLEYFSGGNKTLDEEVPEEGKILHESVLAGFEARANIPGAEMAGIVGNCLEQGELRLAALYMFLYAVVRYGEKGYLDLRPHHTAREYRQMFLKEERTNASGRENFSRLARNFEIAAYRGAAPDDDLGSLWSDLQRELLP